MKKPFTNIPATMLVISAKGTKVKTFGIETLFFSGIGGSLMRIKFNGMLENKINAALSKKTCEPETDVKRDLVKG